MNNSIILFDGACNLCNGFVQFIIKQDRKAVFKFAPLQSSAGQTLLAKHKITVDLKSVILIKEGKVFTQSAAVLMIAVQLGFWWKFFYIFYIIPPVLRNAVYRFVAKYRYKLFGKSICMVPGPEVEHRFLTNQF